MFSYTYLSVSVPININTTISVLIINPTCHPPSKIFRTCHFTVLHKYTDHAIVNLQTMKTEGYKENYQQYMWIHTWIKHYIRVGHKIGVHDNNFIAKEPILWLCQRNFSPIDYLRPILKRNLGSYNFKGHEMQTLVTWLIMQDMDSYDEGTEE